MYSADDLKQDILANVKGDNTFSPLCFQILQHTQFRFNDSSSYTRIQWNTYQRNLVIFCASEDKKELEKCFANFQKILKPNGKIIIDLHNPQTSGTKTDSFNNMKRTMKWEFDQEHKTEKSEIIFEVDNEKYIDNHMFYIFSIDDIKECALKTGLKVLNVFENYDCKKKGISSSKNLQFLIVKKEAKL